MKNNGAMDVCYNVQAVIDGKNHFAIEAEATSDINDLNQLSHMAQKAKDLVQPDKMTSLSDTGHYNKKEIKACVDAGITVYVKKGKSNNGTNENGYRIDFLMTQSGMYTFVPREWRCLSMRILLKMV